MNALPLFKNEDEAFQLLQTKWKSILDPLLKNPLVDGLLLNGLDITSGTTVINHRLGRKMQGWFVVDTDAGTDIYRSAPFNDKTLTLTSGTACVVSLWVF